MAEGVTSPKSRMRSAAASGRLGYASGRANDDDDAATETGSVTGSTVDGSVLGSRLGSMAGGGGSLLNYDGSSQVYTPGVELTAFNGEHLCPSWARLVAESLVCLCSTAISTVLNHPTKRSSPIDPRSSRYPPLSISNSELPTARKADLVDYLNQIRPEWNRFVRNQRLGRHGKARLGEEALLALEENEATAGASQPPETSASGAARFSIDRAALGAPHLALTAASRKNLPSLDAVPKVYFEDDFSLSSPHVFGRVTNQPKAEGADDEDLQSQTEDSDSYDPALNQILQEKLSYYSDIIEQHLIVEIGARSSSFFAALGNLQDLSEEAKSCIGKVNTLRGQLEDVDENQAKKGLQLIVQQARRRELQRKQRAVQAVRELVERRDMVDLLVRQGEFEEALDLMESIRMALQKRASGSDGRGKQADDPEEIDFTRVPSIANIVPSFSKHDHHIAAALQQELLSVLGMELRDRITKPEEPPEAPPRDVKTIRAHKRKSMNLSLSIAAGQLSANGSRTLFEDDDQAREVTEQKLPKPPASLKEKDERLRKRIAGLLLGLVRTKGVERAVLDYKQVAYDAIRSVAASHLKSAPSGIVALITREQPPSEDELEHDDCVDALRQTKHQDFLELGHTYFEGLLECIHGITSQTRITLGLLHQIAHEGKKNGSVEPQITNGTLTASQYDMPEGVSHGLPAAVSELTHSAGELSHACVSRLISIRSSQHAILPLRDFLTIFQLCWSFVLRSELACKRMIMGLRGTVLNQAKVFLTSFHHKRVAAAAKAVEVEKWDPAAVASNVQSEIDRIVASATEDPPDFIVSTEEDGDEDGDPQDGSVKPTAIAETASVKGAQTEMKLKRVQIENKEFWLVPATQDVMGMLGEYLRVVVNLPLLTTEAMTRVVEFLKVRGKLI